GKTAVAAILLLLGPRFRGEGDRGCHPATAGSPLRGEDGSGCHPATAGSPLSRGRRLWLPPCYCWVPAFAGKTAVVAILLLLGPRFRGEDGCREVGRVYFPSAAADSAATTASPTLFVG